MYITSKDFFTILEIVDGDREKAEKIFAIIESKSSDNNCYYLNRTYPCSIPTITYGWTLTNTTGTTDITGTTNTTTAKRTGTTNPYYPISL